MGKAESKIETGVVNKAKELGVISYKFTSPGKIGVPDRIFITPMGKLFFIEFKSEGKRLNSNQEVVKSELERFGQIVHVVDNLIEGFEILNKEVSCER